MRRGLFVLGFLAGVTACDYQPRPNGSGTAPATATATATSKAASGTSGDCSLTLAVDGMT